MCPCNTMYLNMCCFLQIKFLKDSKKGKVVTKNHSRGVAFVEFTEHQHALVALRVLNNNPGMCFFSKLYAIFHDFGTQVFNIIECYYCRGLQKNVISMSLIWEMCTELFILISLFYLQKLLVLSIAQLWSLLLIISKY